MCGIAGIIAPPGVVASREKVRRMCDAIIHRGPDDEGVLAEGAVALGMRRLSIIDLASGHQPVHNEDRTVWVVFNGEIYNYRELRIDLEQRGHRFYTHSDTETLVHLYEEYGDGFVSRLNGMFSFAIWDSRRRRVIIARDRIGEKQIYYATRNGHFVFGSEIKTLLASGMIEREIDRKAVDQYLKYLYVPAPATIFKAIRELPPATIVILEEGGAPRFERYWKPSFKPDLRWTEADAVSEVQRQLVSSVRSRLISDVPLGALLSGGIDSSAIVAAMVESGAGPVRTFTVGYGEEGKVYDERDQARQLARHLGTEHHEFIVKPDILDVLPKLVRAFDQPFADSSAVANYYVFRETRKHVKVVLSGLGGDEVFAGYERHMAIRFHQTLGVLPAWIRSQVLARFCEMLPEPRDGGRTIDRLKRFARASGLPASEAYMQYVTAFDAGRRGALYTDAMMSSLDPLGEAQEFADHFASCGDLDELSGALYVDTLTYLPGDLLTLTDRMSMVHSVEARAPFLDHDFLEMAASIPARFKIRGREKKHLLRAATRTMLPQEVFDRPKRGFTIPLTVWLRGELAPYMREALSRTNIERVGLFNWQAVDRLVQEHVSHRQNHHARLWALLVFMAWHSEYIDKQPSFTAT